MLVKLLHHSPLEVADIAISKCYDKAEYSDYEKQKNRINRIANVNKHSSTIEHLNYSFDIDGISRAVLQELARHRIASYTVKSTRYTLKELKSEESFMVPDIHGAMRYYPDIKRASKYIVLTNTFEVDEFSVRALDNLRQLIVDGASNDMAKYCLPESYKTALVMTVNARSLQNFLALRTDSHALWEIQNLAQAMYEAVPEDHKFLFKDYLCLK